jgi:hypothetical protein
VTITTSGPGDARLMDEDVWRAFAERFTTTWEAAVRAQRDTAEQEPINHAHD